MSDRWAWAVLLGGGRYQDAHWYGQALPPDRGIQSACGDMRELSWADLTQPHPENRRCLKCLKILDRTSEV